MLQLGQDFGFLFEAGHELRIIGKVTRQNFKRDIALHRRLKRFVYCRHPTFAQWRDDLIRAEALAGQIFHR